MIPLHSFSDGHMALDKLSFVPEPSQPRQYACLDQRSFVKLHCVASSPFNIYSLKKSVQTVYIQEGLAPNN